MDINRNTGKKEVIITWTVAHFPPIELKYNS